MGDEERLRSSKSAPGVELSLFKVNFHNTGRGSELLSTPVAICCHSVLVLSVCHVVLSRYQDRGYSFYHSWEGVVMMGAVSGDSRRFWLQGRCGGR